MFTVHVWTMEFACTVNNVVTFFSRDRAKDVQKGSSDIILHSPPKEVGKTSFPLFLRPLFLSASSLSSCLARR